MDSDPTKAKATPTVERRADTAENPALQPLRVESEPFSRDKAQIQAADGINLVQQDLLQFVDGIGRRSKDLNASRSINRSVGVKEQAGERLPDRPSIPDVFMRKLQHRGSGYTVRQGTLEGEPVCSAMHVISGRASPP